MSVLQLFSKSRGLRIGLAVLVVAVIFTRRRMSGGNEAAGPTAPAVNLLSAQNPDILSAGFVVTDRVFNSELMAPYDVFQHSIFRDTAHYIEPFIVSEKGLPTTSFEGITILPHFSFETAPAIDILVVPSANGSMSTDLKNDGYLEWLANAAENAQYVLTLCDGSFPVAATGQLDGRTATTFPGDRRAFVAAYPKVDVRFDVRFVRDGKFITSVGGGMSYEPALYLVELLYGKEHAELTAEGLVWNWDLDTVPHLVVENR